MNLHHSAAYAGLLRLVATGIGLIFGIALVRLGSAEIKGFASAFMAANSLLFAVLNWDVPQGLLRNRRTQRSVGVGLLNDVARVWLVYLTLAVLAILVCLVAGLDPWVAAGAVGFGLVTQTGGILNGLKGPVLLGYSVLIQQASLVLGVLVLSVFGRVNSPFWVMLVIMAAYGTAFFLNLMLLRSEWRLEDGRVFSSLRGLFRSGAHWQLTRIGQAALQRADILLVAGILGAGAAGVYSVAVAMAGLATTLVVQYSHLVIFDSMRGLGVDINGLLLRSLMHGGAAFVGLLILGYPALVMVYGPAFADGYVPMLIISVGAVAFALAQTITNKHRMTGRSVESNIAFVTGSLVMVTCMTLFVPTFGLKGAAVSYLAGSATALVCLLWWGARAAESRNNY